MKRYSTLLVGDPDGPGFRVLSALGSVIPYAKDRDIKAADLVAVDIHNLDGLDAAELFTEVLEAGRSLVVFNLDSAASDLLMKVTGARPHANSFAAVYRRTCGPGAARRLFHSFIRNDPQESRGSIDKEGGGFEKVFEWLLYGVKRHFQTVEQAPMPSPLGSMTPPNCQEAPFSQLTTSWSVVFPVSGAQNLSQTSVDLTLNFFFYNSDANQESSQNNYLVVVLLSLTNMTPGGVVVYAGVGYQYTQVFSYGATVQALQQDGSAFPSGVSMGTTSPAPTSSVPQTLVDVLASPTPVMYVITSSGRQVMADWAPTYSNTISQTDSPNLQWYTVVNNDNSSANTFGVTYVMPESMWGGGNVTNGGVPNTSTMTMEFVNYFTFNCSLGSGTEPNQSLPVQFLVSAIAAMTEDNWVISSHGGSDYIDAQMNLAPNQPYTYDVAKLSQMTPT